MPASRTAPQAGRAAGGAGPAPRAAAKVWRSSRWWFFILANTAQALGWFLPPLYLPTFAAVSLRQPLLPPFLDQRG